MGGIVTATDAVEFILAGASAVAVGTASFVHPDAAIGIAQGISAYLSENGFASVGALVGAIEQETTAR